MRLSSEELQQLYREMTGRAVRGGQSCPTAEALGRAAAGEMEERRLLAEHLGTCSDCALEFRLARALGPWAEQVAPTRAEPKRLGRGFSLATGWRPLGAAAALIVAVGLAATAWRSFRGLELSSSSERGAAPLAEKTLPADGATLLEPPRELAWEKRNSEENYEFVLFDSESTPIWRSPVVEGPRVAFPQEIRARVEQGGHYYWRVFYVSGVERLESPLFQFTVVR